MADATFFDERARQWDAPRRVARAEVIAEKITSILCEKPCTDALEFGCGAGLIGMLLARRFGSVVLMDTSVRMIEEVERKIRKVPASNVTPVLHDLTAEDYPGSFSCIFSSMAMHHVAEPVALMRRFRQMLREGGLLCIVDLDEDDGFFHSAEESFSGHHGFSHNEVFRFFAEAGLRDVAVETFYRDEKTLGGDTKPYSLFCASGVRLTAGSERKLEEGKSEL